jgi:hypothetical protein
MREERLHGAWVSLRRHHTQPDGGVRVPEPCDLVGRLAVRVLPGTRGHLAVATA